MKIDEYRLRDILGLGHSRDMESFYHHDRLRKVLRSEILNFVRHDKIKKSVTSFQATDKPDHLIAELRLPGMDVVVDEVMLAEKKKRGRPATVRNLDFQALKKETVDPVKKKLAELHKPIRDSFVSFLSQIAGKASADYASNLCLVEEVNQMSKNFGCPLLFLVDNSVIEVSLLVQKGSNAVGDSGLFCLRTKGSQQNWVHTGRLFPVFHFPKT